MAINMKNIIILEKVDSETVRVVIMDQDTDGAMCVKDIFEFETTVEKTRSALTWCAFNINDDYAFQKDYDFGRTRTLLGKLIKAVAAEMAA